MVYKTKSKLDGKIDLIVEMLIAGDSYRTIAKKLDVALSTLHDFTYRPEHSARIKDALDYSACSFDEKAEEALIEIKPNSTPIEMTRARELAHHWRWKAAKRSQKRYGDKIDVDGSGTIMPPINVHLSGS